MHRGRKRTSYIPFPLNPETRSDVIPARLHFRETIPQARQPISHRRVCVNNGMVSITHFKVSRGDIISFKENDARARGEEIRRSCDIEISVEKRIGKFRDHPVRMWRRTKTEWFRLLLKFRFLQQLRSSMQEKDLERTKKFGGSIKVCLGSSFAEHNRMKRNLYHFKSLFLSKRRNEKNRNLPTRTRSSIVYNSSLYSNYEYSDYNSSDEQSLTFDSYTIPEDDLEFGQSRLLDSTYCSAPPHQFTMKRKRKKKRIELPTHYSEVNHRTLKAVVSYGPNIGHIPHDIRLKDPNLLLQSGNGRGQNI
nr:ribosomal protein S4 [Bupleurum chinense]UJH19966.1 ribosomal protein S4 [Bupleurum chinense]